MTDAQTLGTERSAARSPLDRLGIIASSTCAVHCGICALVPALLATLGLGALLSHSAEWAFVAVAVTVALLSLWRGYRLHRSRRVAALIVAGTVGLLVARGVEEAGAEAHHHHDAHEGMTAHSEQGEGEHSGGLVGASLGVIAGLVLMLGHVVNIRESRCCETCG